MNASKLDLFLATVIAIGFPFLAAFLYDIAGALIPMVLYYGLAWGIVKWRRGSTGYFNEIKVKWPKSFILNTSLILISLYFAYHARIIDKQSTIIGVVFTLCIWAPLNASSEQLLWIYIFEAFDLYPSEDTSKMNKNIYRVFGLLLFAIFVGLIHQFFWVKFLHTVNPELTAGIIFVVITAVTGFIHIAVWRESNNMVYTFVPHLLLNIGPTLWTGYSILPYLISI